MMTRIENELKTIQDSRVLKEELHCFMDEIQNHYLHINDDHIFLIFLEFVLDRCKKAKKEELNEQRAGS